MTTTPKAALCFIAVVLSGVSSILVASAADTNIWREAGVPSPDREWMSFDYTLAAKVFSSGKAPLPQLSDPAGKKLLDAITSTNNLAFYRNKSLPIQSRLSAWLAGVDGAKEITKQYLALTTKGQHVESEMTQMEAFLLYISNVGLELADEFISQIPKDEKYEVRMEGVAKMNSGIVTEFVGASVVLTAPETYDSHDRQVILSAMAEVLPRFKKAFPASYVDELKQKLVDARSTITESTSLSLIRSMLDTLDH